jgi:hypothetical protein
MELAANLNPRSLRSIMSNTDIYAQLATRVTEEKLTEITTEVKSLDAREADLISKALNCEAGTIEHLHVRTRLAALVAAGTISSDLAEAATPVESTDSTGSFADYEFSRDAFLQTLANQQYSSDLLKNPYDAEGILSRMVARGDSKQQVKDYLEQNSYFRGQRDFTTIAPEDLDLEEQIALFKYLEFAQALEDLVDPENTPDFASNAKTLVAPYDEGSKISEMIDAGASSADILAALKENALWVDHLYDYTTRLDVDSPSPEQKATWRSFGQIVFALKDLDATQISN